MTSKGTLALPNGKAYVFHDAKYDRFDFQSGAREQADIETALEWRGLPAQAPDAALYLGFGKAYFFYGTKYIRYDLGLSPALAEGAEAEWLPPNGIDITAGWRGLGAEPIDAAVNWGNGKLYFFRGPQYFRYDIALDCVDPDYPKDIEANWPGLWKTGVDSALYQGGRYAYFFKGEEFVSYDVYGDVYLPARPIDDLQLEPVPSGMLTSGRDLTLRQALDVIAYLIDHNKLTLARGAGYVGPWNSAGLPTSAKRLIIEPPTIDGVTYQNDAGPASVIDNVDPRMAVVLYRLARWMNASEPTVDMIKHKGIGHGNGPATDCHNQGRALDFSGLTGTSREAPFQRSVLADWGKRPVVPGAAMRLDPAIDAIAHDLFRAAHRFATYECECNAIGAANAWPPKEIGDRGGFVIHPDYVDASAQPLRAAHQDHVHMQVGPTR